MTMLTDSRPSLAPAAFAPLPEEAPADIGFFDAIGPAFRSENIVGSTIMSAGPTVAEMSTSPRVNPWQQIAGTKYEPYYDDFASVSTLVEVDRIKAQIDREEADRRVIQEAGWGGMGAALLAGTLDLPSLIPGGAVVGGGRALQVAGRTALVAGLTTAGEEAVLQSQQQTRTGGESATAIGGSVVLGGMLGGALGAVLARSPEGMTAWKAASAEIERNVAQPQDLSAAAAIKPELTDFALPTKGAELARRLTPGGLSFTDRLQKAQSPVVRQIGNDLIGNEYAFAGTDRLGMEPSVEALVKPAVDRHHITIAKAFRDDFKAFAKEGGSLTRGQYAERVAMAMRRGDEDPEFPQVSATAQALRASVVEPLKNQAVKLGLLPEDVHVSTAASYFTRMWDQNRLIARSDEFLTRLTAHFERGEEFHASRAEAKAQDELSARLADLQDLTDPDRGVMSDEAFAAVRDAPAWRQRRAGLNKQRKEVRRSPLVDYVLDHGGIDPDGALGQEMKALGIRRPGLFRKGGLKEVDNIGPDDVDLAEHVPLDGHYFDRNAMMSRLGDELQGRAEQPAWVRDIDDEIAALDELLGMAKETGASASREKIRGLRDKIATLEERAREASRRADMSPDEVKAYARMAAEAVYDTLTNAPSPTSTMFFKVPVTRGPLKERTLSVADKDFEDFLNNDAEHVLTRYARVMTAENELASRFGRADMRDQIAEIKADYAKLRDAAETEKARLAIDKEMRRVIKSTEAARDLVRGTYNVQAKASGPYRVMQAAMSYNYIRALGDVVASSLTDVFKVTMANGLMPVAREALVPMMRNLKTARVSQKKAAELAGIAEPLLNSRLMAIADIMDPYATRTPVEGAINWMASKASLLSGVMHWTQFLKEISVGLAQNRMARMMTGDLKAADQRFLRRLKINSSRWEQLKAQMAEHGEWTNGVFDPGTEHWPDDLRKMYSSILRAEADTTIVTPGVGDKVPLAEEHWFLKPALQFKSFALASQRKTLMVGLQDSPARFAQSAALMASMGMFVYWLKQVSSGREPSHNPGTWLAEGIDRAGLLPIVMEMNNTVEKMGAPGFYAGMAGVFGGDPSRSSRYQVRGTADALLGPTAGLINDTATLARAPWDGEFSQGEVSASRRLVPFGRHPGIKQFLDWYTIPEDQK